MNKLWCVTVAAVLAVGSAWAFVPFTTAAGIQAQSARLVHPSASVPGCEGFDVELPADPWDFEGPGVQVVDGHLQMDNPTGASTNTATLTLDFSVAAEALLPAGNMSVLLRFRYMNIGDEPGPADGVFIGLTRLHELGNTDGLWQEVEIYLTDFVDPNLFAAPVELVFKQQDDQPWPADGILLDDVCVGLDCNGDGIFDHEQVNPEIPELNDCNGNGALDGCEIMDDCNEDGVPDQCDPTYYEWWAQEDDDGDGVINYCDKCPGFDDAQPESWPWITHMIFATALEDASAFDCDKAQYLTLKDFVATYGKTTFASGETFNVEIWVANLKQDNDGLTIGEVDADTCGSTCALQVNEFVHGQCMDFGYPTGVIQACEGTGGTKVVDLGAGTDNFQPMATYHAYNDWEWVMVGRLTVTMPQDTCLGEPCGDDPSGMFQLADGTYALFGLPVPPEKVYYPPALEVTTRCPAWMYDMDGNGLVNFLDLLTPAWGCTYSFATAWLHCEGDPEFCEQYDWYCDGCIDQYDLGYWATAYDKCCDDETIVLPDPWPCNGMRAGEPLVPPASDDFIKALGLPLPSKDGNGER